MQMAQELLLLVASEENRGQTNQSIAHYCLAHFDDLLHMSIPPAGVGLSRFSRYHYPVLSQPGIR